jgi:predicted alpha/beta hydrolase
MARIVPNSISSLDGYPLDIAFFEPFGRRSNYRRIVLINSGAGIPKTFYEPFASWLADEGIPVLTYDYRGIGGSRGKTIRRFPASIRDWGSKDCAAAIQAAQTRYPDARIIVIGHSIGSVVTGFVSKPPTIESFLLVCPHTGYSGDYAGHSRKRMFLLWHVLMPAITRIAGYFPGRWFGLPEDLPRGVALEWANRRDKDKLKFEGHYGAFVKIAARALAIRPGDDPFSTYAAMQRVRAAFPSTEFVDLSLSGGRWDAIRIGHFGFFKERNREVLWPIALNWVMRSALDVRNLASCHV